MSKVAWCERQVVANELEEGGAREDGLQAVEVDTRSGHAAEQRTRRGSLADSAVQCSANQGTAELLID